MASDKPQHPVRTRIAPSPTGFMHIGNARTALFNWLFARAMGGRYLVRIEDTDRERSTDAAIDVIKQSLEWLGLPPDEPYVLQSENIARHHACIEKLVKEGKAYECFCTVEEVEAIREERRNKGLKPKYDGRHRDLSDDEKETFRREGRKAAIRLKLPDDGFVTWTDAVQGPVRIANEELDDFIIQRSDGTPTYNFVVAVDDADMAISHVIRGDDHINNTPKQIHVYRALGVEPPIFAHVPLIHGPDGKKLSKRHGAQGVNDLKAMGYVREAVCNYFARLGWAFGDQEIFTKEEAAQAFQLENLSKSAAIFDFTKLDWVNGEHMKTMPPAELLAVLKPFLPADAEISDDLLCAALPLFVPRAHRLDQLANQLGFLAASLPVPADEKAANALNGEQSEAILNTFADRLEKLQNYDEPSIEEVMKAICSEKEISFKLIGMPARVALTGRTDAPGVAALAALLGRDASVQRLRAATSHAQQKSASA